VYRIFFMSKHYISYYNSPVGWLKINTSEDALAAISFEEESGASSEHHPKILQDTILQLQEYFEGKRKVFALKLNPEGTSFQKEIWELVKQVKYGETASYLDIALSAGSEKKTRAVGLANGKNPIPIIIPCHRIIGSSGKLTGYAGGLDRKRWLLLHEQKNSPSQLLF